MDVGIVGIVDEGAALLAVFDFETHGYLLEFAHSLTESVDADVGVEG